MRFPKDIKKCVVFIGLEMADKKIVICGTGFVIYDDISAKNLSYLVTAKHVIDGIRGKGLDQVFIRINLLGGSSQWYTTEIKKWKLNSDPNVDVAIYQSSGDDNWDHVSYRLGTSMTDELIKENEIDLGDEVFIIGLFIHHSGQQKNIPIVRIGNISAMPEEKIRTGRHLMDGYLIEARSIGGLSGSPVFVNLEEVRYINGSVKQGLNGTGFLLMGLIYGHYDVMSSDIDIDQQKFTKVNSGIAIVTPVEKILETIQQ